MSGRRFLTVLVVRPRGVGEGRIVPSLSGL